MAMGVLQDLRQQRSFNLIDNLLVNVVFSTPEQGVNHPSEITSLGSKRSSRARRLCPPAKDVRQKLRQQNVACGVEHGLLEHALELADVSRPVVALEQLE